MLVKTTFHGPTDRSGSRIGARWADNSGRTVRVPYRHNLSSSAAHESAVRAYLDYEDIDYESIECVDGYERGYYFLVR